jgi:hypothetical protein
MTVNFILWREAPEDLAPTTEDDAGRHQILRRLRGKG